MRVVLAIVLGLVVLVLGLGTLRGFLGPRGGGTGEGPSLEVAKPLPVGLRILYWCENCGLEVLTIRAGSDASPRHCGEPMVRREETLRDG